jgi:nucleoid-associated protein YgaU
MPLPTPEGRAHSGMARLMLCFPSDAPASSEQVPPKGGRMSFFTRKKDASKRADFSNVQTGSSSTAAQGPSLPEPPEITGPAGEQQTHVVAKGESLSKIAKQYYGDGNQWQRIYDANRDQISNPDLIHPGQTLKIPSA